MFRPNPPYVPPPRTTYNPFFYYDDYYPGLEGGGIRRPDISRPGPQPIPNLPEPDVEDTQVRTFFPESWIFSLLRTR